MPVLWYKRPFYYDVVEGKPFFFTTELTRVRIQVELLLIFLESDGQLWALDDYWTPVSVLTGHSAATADFIWCPSHISVSMTWFDVVLHREKILMVVGKQRGSIKGNITKI